MSWDSKDSQRHRGRGPAGTVVSELPAPAAPKEGLPEVLPTVADMLFWDAATNDQWQDAGVSHEEARELAALGMISDRQWDAWSRIARRGVQEV